MGDLFVLKRKYPQLGDERTRKSDESTQKSDERTQNSDEKIASITQEVSQNDLLSRKPASALGFHFPMYPLCQELFGVYECDSKTYLTCMSIFKEMDNRASTIYLINRLKKKKGLSVELHSLIPNAVWNSETWEVYESDSEDPEYCVALTDFPKFVEWAQQRTRKTQAEKERNLKKFHIPFDAVETKVPIENEMLDVLQQVLPYKLEFQYRIGKYKVDAFIPRLRIAVEIDEQNHKGYNLNEQKEYEEVLRDANIILIRFNPHEKYNEKVPYALVKKVWERSIAPDFTTFKDKMKL